MVWRMTTPMIAINPEVLKWARESIGYTIDDVSNKTKFPNATIREWEEKPSEIPFAALEKLANAFKRPTIALLLDRPPEEPKAPPYFRKSGGKAELSPAVRLAIRKVRNLQRISRELIENVENQAPVFSRAKLSDSPEEIARRERANLGIKIEEQTKYRDAAEALRRFRTAIEDRGVFVFQYSGPINEVQGLSLIDKEAPAILLNSKDMPERRLFTLFHEYAHLLLDNPGVCADIEQPVNSANGLEVWCNRFARSLLVPKSELQGFVGRRGLSGRITYKDIAAIASHFHVSKHMVFVCLKSDGLLSGPKASELENIFKRTPDVAIAKSSGKRAKQKGGVPGYKKSISELGLRYVDLVLKGEAKRRISTSEALDYLSVKIEGLEKMKAALER